jgi:hypothetical protein
MFAMQHYMDSMPDPARKRIRDDEDDTANAPTSFIEHRSKRQQTLPLRTSPTSSHRNAPMAIETDAGLADSGYRSHYSAWTSQTAAPAPQDTEMDMMDAVPQNQTEGMMYHPDPEVPSADTGRMPTPIQPSFAAQIRGQQVEWAGADAGVSPLNGTVNLGHHHAGFSGDHGMVPRTMGSEGNWNTVHSTRRLPSPISEADDGNAEAFCNHGDTSPHAMEHPNAMMDVESPRVNTAGGDSDGGDPASPSPRSKGHIRSKHTIDNWTWQPGMKKSFSIGYRSDCEKCKLKVPGHFNHIIIS